MHRLGVTVRITACEEATLYSLEAVYFQDLVAGYARLGEALAQTGSRRLGFVEEAGISPRREE